MAGGIIALIVGVLGIAALVYRLGVRRALLVALEVAAGVLLVTLLFYLYDKIK